jgi:hypothetical protein
MRKHFKFTLVCTIWLQIFIILFKNAVSTVEILSFLRQRRWNEQRGDTGDFPIYLR